MKHLGIILSLFAVLALAATAFAGSDTTVGNAANNGYRVASGICHSPGLTCISVTRKGAYVTNQKAKSGQVEITDYDHICYTASLATGHETVQTGWGPNSNSSSAKPLFTKEYARGNGC